MKQIDKHYNKSIELGLNQVEKLARKILRKYSTLTDFFMHNGVWWFNGKKGKWYSKYSIKYNLDELIEFMDYYDTKLKLSMNTVWFTKDGEVVKNFSEIISKF